MARTINPAAHALRRDTFIDAAQQLIGERGYEQLSIGDVLSATGASRGALYHYFDSKAELLEAVVDRMTDAVLVEVGPLLDDPRLTAIEKLDGLFARIGSWKTERRELLLSVLETWYSDENIVVRDKFRRDATARMTPVLARIIEQGTAEGTIDATSPQHTAELLVALLMGLNERAGHLFMARQAGAISYDDVRAALAAYVVGFERILGLSPGSLTMVDESTLETWFR